MTSKFDRDFIESYVKEENEKNQYHAPLEAMDTIVPIIQHFGVDIYRPITRLLLANWQELSARIENYGSDQWAKVKAVEVSTPELSPFAIAMLMEVLEGEDTLNQDPEAGRKLTDEELKAIRTAQDPVDTALDSAESK